MSETPGSEEAVSGEGSFQQDPVVWQGFTRSALDAAYNNMAAVPDSADRLADWAARSAALRARMPKELELAYGPHERNRIDVFRSGQTHAPLLVFIHGGWWQRNSKEVFSCMAEGPLAHSMDVALVGYTLAPGARLTAIAAEINAALDWLQAREAAGSCILSGWSAGGHLTALTMGHTYVAAGLSISGVFDLEPIRHSYINDKLCLDTAEARDLSPANLPPVAKPMVIAFGGRELPELQRQSTDYARQRALLIPHTVTLPMAGHDHFSILDELAAPDGLLCAQALALAGTLTP
jgi:acetyl esterase/lipase